MGIFLSPPIHSHPPRRTQLLYLPIYPRPGEGWGDEFLIESFRFHPH